MTYEEILQIPPYSLNKVKNKLLNRRLHELTNCHYEHCEAYQRMCDALDYDVTIQNEYHNIRFFR